ncbi:hypothetical protein AL036_21745 [Salipiger aestuarii]|uniref:hypothetical protein n=1 Tax=Salipiger aestuarii TaxID=568098 RepID=UPI00025B6AFE|nr:hypothetical protein [Salipiger aestuarii]EIE49679.1 hypothetical protein C357_17635 [Citreicella sp. 357]KAA8604333.1 hypothetical protein AL036_21745 [Salipiger aestuarii]
MRCCNATKCAPRAKGPPARIVLRRHVVRNARISVLTVLGLAPVLSLQNARAMNIPGRFSAPSAAHWLGQDGFGRGMCRPG